MKCKNRKEKPSQGTGRNTVSKTFFSLMKAFSTSPKYHKSLVLKRRKTQKTSSKVLPKSYRMGCTQLKRFLPENHWRRDCQCRKVLPNCGWVYSLRKPSVSWRLDPWARRCDTSHRQKNDGIFWRKKSSISAVASQFPRRKCHRKRLGNIEKCSWAKKSKNQARTDWSNTEFQKCHHEGNQRKFDEFCWKASKVL